jgi:hypothetical protein
MLAKSPNQREQGTFHGGKNILEFRDKFHIFMISIKIPLNFYRFNLVLARLKFKWKIWCMINFYNIFRT